MVEETQQLKLDQNPSPKAEAKQFQNADERAHQIALIVAKKGVVGKLTGSTNDAMNTGTLILIICLFLWGASMVGVCFKADAFSPISDNVFKAVLAVAGYVFGTKTTNG